MGVLNAKEEQAALSFLSGRCRRWMFRFRRALKYGRAPGAGFEPEEMAEHSAVRALENAINAVLDTERTGRQRRRQRRVRDGEAIWKTNLMQAEECSLRIAVLSERE